MQSKQFIIRMTTSSSLQFVSLKLLVFFIFFSSLLYAQAPIPDKTGYGKDTIKAFKIKSIKQFKDDRVEFFWEYNPNGDLLQFIVYNYFGDPFLAEKKIYNSEGILIEEKKTHEQERYDQQILYYKDKNGWNVKEHIRYLKPDSQRIEIQLERMEDQKIRGQETYKIINDKPLLVKTIKDSIAYDYHTNQRLKSKTSYSDQRMLNKEIFNEFGKQLEEVHYSNGKERRRSDWKYISDTLLLEEVHYYYETNIVSATKYEYNSKGNLLKKIFFETGMDAEHTLYRAIYRKGKIAEESEYGLNGILIYKNRYDYPWGKIKITQVNRFEITETIKDKKSGNIYSIFHFEKNGKSKGGTSWKYDREGRKVEERVYETKGAKGKRTQLWKYDTKDRLILYVKGVDDHYDQLIKYDYDKKDHLLNCTNCRFSQDTICDILICTYDAIGNLIKESSMDKQRILTKTNDQAGFVGEVPVQNATTIEYTYNFLNLLIGKKTQDSKGNLVFNERFEYDYFR